MRAMRKNILRLGVLGAAAIAALGALACQSSDPVAIEGSSIILTAQPNPVSPGAISQVQARVTSTNGVPEKSTIVFFSTSSGTVTPDSDTTDSVGVATTNFVSNTPTTATLTARSGGVSSTLQITVIVGTPTTHILTTSDSVIDTVCTDVIQLSGSLLGTGGAPIAGAAVTFQVVSSLVNGSPPSTPLTGSFNPSAAVTSASGTYSVNFTINPQQCQASCVGTSNSCSINIKATAASLDSNQVTITDNL